MKNDELEVRYLQGESVQVVRVMDQDELAELLVNDGVFLLSVNADKTYRVRKSGHSCAYVRGR